MFRRLTKKRAIVALSVVAALVIAGGAVAYFTSTGSGTGSASVGTSSNFTVAVSSDTSNALLPGSGSETLTYTVTNPGPGHQGLTGTSSAVASSGGNITQKGAPVTGCLASWFHAANTAPTPLPQDLASSGTSTPGSVVVTMDNVNASQDACKNATPDITVSAF